MRLYKGGTRLVRSRLGLTGLLLGLCGCTFGSEGAFVSGADLITCNDAIPVCNTTAGCKMVEEDHYIEGEFPGFRQFIVETAGESVIRLKFYWRSQLSPGADTEIRWFEPACVESYSYQSEGLDIFEEAGSSGIWFRDKRVFREGDHLIEVRSDATGDYVLRTEVLTIDEWEAEQTPTFGSEG